MLSPGESSGYVGPEAQACGVPLVAFANEGARRLCQDNVTGFLVQKVTARKPAERILEIIDDAVILARISITARENNFQGIYRTTDQHITYGYKAALS